MHATQPTPISVPSKPLAFDKLSFVKYVKDIGRRYIKQAMKLVSISRTFAQAQEHTPSSYDELRSVLQVVDDALGSATEARKKTSSETDAKFKNAIDALSAYEKK
ncbi:hypothetical protein F5888DRAFT_1906654 [Russula emetica]|nr:hypothetical protein F5888DRAFT_1906654 [Russula emetica]